MEKEIKVWNLQEDKIPHALVESKRIDEDSSKCHISKDQIFISKVQCEEQEQKHCGPQMTLERKSSLESKQKEWTVEEERLLVQLHNLKGNRWVEIARQLQRSDNSVKNHYHSRLRKALRKINKCIVDHLSNECRALKSNLLSRIIQTAEAHYSPINPTPQAQAHLAFKLKNDILSFVQLSQQQATLQQIDQVRNLISQISEFNKKYKKQDRSSQPERPNCNKYKGKEIISLLEENMLKNSSKAKNSKICQDVQEESILNHNAGEQAEGRCQVNSYCGNIGVFSNFQGFYIFNQPIFPFCYSILPPATPNLFSGKTSSFTYYAPEGDNIADQPTWTSMPQIQSEFRMEQRSDVEIVEHVVGQMSEQ